MIAVEFKRSIMASVNENQPKDCFSIALAHYLEKSGRGSETALAIDSGVAQPTISRIKLGRSYGLRANCNKIAAALNTTYEDMIALGRRIYDGDDIEDDKQLNDDTPINDDAPRAHKSESGVLMSEWEKLYRKQEKIVERLESRIAQLEGQLADPSRKARR